MAGEWNKITVNKRTSKISIFGTAIVSMLHGYSTDNALQYDGISQQ